ncbi:uncharacterized protein TRIVIDRAFT_68999 [Trichoderma virens Gv29-8]|uniref:Transcription factor domain-containing protein n=1 Tax=Hypocrea virens (strain Gv29-8 / FGSC 10586) TaxID=413071 RepID=G9MY42_HYPVG|nr:uncharacterized protein TRIVIDRAFT_68999 [Trichoderma virens Gv29-8]EHK20464.1 hypothetical protein TRIVIDRAFT_68999 [Trichoderma virens Gv29-8]
MQFGGSSTTSDFPCDGYQTTLNSSPAPQLKWMLAMFFPDDFWSTRVLQMAYSESCIRHALIALSAYHERYIYCSPGSDYSFALRHYNFAINGLSNARHGLSLIHLIFGITRQELLDMSCIVLETNRPKRPPEFAFRQLAEAREVIHGIALEWMSDRPAGGAALSALVNRFEEWCQAFEAFDQENRHLLTSAADRRALTLLELQKRYLATHLSILKTKEINDETMWDGYSNEFNEMLNIAEASMQIHDSGVASNRQPRFHMDTGVIPILFAIITRCRDPFIRRRAIELMTWNPMQEGLWNSVLVAKAAQRLITLEEGTVAVGSSSDISAEARVQGISVYAGDERHVVLRFSQALGYWQESIDY